MVRKIFKKRKDNPNKTKPNLGVENEKYSQL